MQPRTPARLAAATAVLALVALSFPLVASTGADAAPTARVTVSSDGTSVDGLPWSPTANPAFTLLSAVSCTSTTFCMTVGDSETPPAQRQTSEFVGSADVWNGSTWRALPAGSGSTGLTGVSCSSPTSCVAVGQSLSGVDGNDRVVADVQQWNGTAWADVPLSLPVDAAYSYLSAISCPAATQCVAVGSAASLSDGLDQVPLVGLWQSGQWTFSELTAPAGTDVSLRSVSCPTTTFCAADGSADAGTLTTAYGVMWNGTTWTVDSPKSPGGNFNPFGTISCASATSCVAGEDNEGGGVQSVIESWNGTTWTVDNAGVSGESEWGYQGSTCTTGGPCLVVGSASNIYGLDNLPVVQSLSGSTWTREVIAQPSAPGGGQPVSDFVDGVDCTGPTFCVLVGSVNQGPLVETWNGSGWTQRSAPGLTPLDPPVTASASNAAGTGTWTVDAWGDLVTQGTATDVGSLGEQFLNAPIVGIAPTADGQGYWMVASDGGVFAFGDARFYGSMGGTKLNQPIVGMAATADGRGYWLVAADGGVFAFGDARFHGSMGGTTLNQPIVGMASDATTGGYRLVAADGGIFSFDAPFEGSTGNLHLNAPITGMATSPSGSGYWMVAADGGVFAFGDARFHGSEGGTAVPAPYEAITADPATGGYWLTDRSGYQPAFDATVFGGA